MNGYRKLVSWYVIIVGVSSGSAWMREEMKMLLGYESELLERQSTSALPVQALDLGFIVPLHVYGGVQLLRDKPVGYLIVSMCLMLSSTLLVAVAAMAQLLRRRDLVSKEDPGSFFLTAVASIGLLLSYFWFCGKKTAAKG